ncbi:hypothetical protein Gpo141_00006770 [Globisporangium polare]
MKSVTMAMRRLNARSFTSAAPLPASTPAASTGATVGATASASTKANVGTIARKKKKKQSTDQRFATVGLPLLLFVAGGYMALTQFVGGKFEARDHIIKSHTTREFDLEEEHKNMTKKLVLDDFEIKPVPKPGESTK